MMTMPISAIANEVSEDLCCCCCCCSCCICVPCNCTAAADCEFKCVFKFCRRWLRIAVVLRIPKMRQKKAQKRGLETKRIAEVRTQPKRTFYLVIVVNVCTPLPTRYLPITVGERSLKYLISHRFFNHFQTEKPTEKSLKHFK